MVTSSQHFFLTGASGWIGSHATSELLAAGHRVSGLARSDASAAAIEAAGATAVRGSLDDLDVLREAASAADGVIHLGFKHDEMFSGDVEAALAAEHAVLAVFGAALAGSGKPLAIAAGLAGQPAGRVVTEADRPAPDAVGGRTAVEGRLLALAGRDVRAISLRFAATTHGMGDTGFTRFFVDAAREHGVAGYLGDGANHWPAVHVTDAARVIRLAAESAPAGTVVHATGERGVPMRDIATAVGARYDLPVRRVEPEHFGWFAMFAGMDVQASSDATQRRLGWTPEGPTLLEDVAAGAYDADA